MNLGSIFKRIEDGIQDPSFTREGDLILFVNDFVLEMSSMFRLPALMTKQTVTVPGGSEFVVIEDFGRDLFRARHVTRDHGVTIRQNVKSLEALGFGVRKGDHICNATMNGDRLYFAPAPHEEAPDQELEVWYYRTPTMIEDADDDDAKLDGIPDELASVCVDYVLVKLFLLVEDGIEGPEINVRKHSAMYQAGLTRFENYCRDSPKPTPVLVRTARFF